MKNPNIYSAYTKNFQQNFENIFFPKRKQIDECGLGKCIDSPQPLKVNIIECRRCGKAWGLFLHLWYKCLLFGNYESKQGCKNAADILQKKYLPNFEIIVEESFF